MLHQFKMHKYLAICLIVTPSLTSSAEAMDRTRAIDFANGLTCHVYKYGHNFEKSSKFSKAIISGLSVLSESISPRTLSQSQVIVISGEISDGRVDPNSFAEIFERTCAFNVAVEIGKNPLLKAPFELLQQTPCQYLVGNGPLQDSDALSAAKDVLTGKLDANTFKAAYKETCEFSQAEAIATITLTAHECKMTRRSEDQIAACRETSGADGIKFHPVPSGSATEGTITHYSSMNQ